MPKYALQASQCQNKDPWGQFELSPSRRCKSAPYLNLQSPIVPCILSSLTPPSGNVYTKKTVTTGTEEEEEALCYVTEVYECIMEINPTNIEHEK